MLVHVRLRFLFVVVRHRQERLCWSTLARAIVDTLGFLGTKRGCILWIRLWVERKV